METINSLFEQDTPPSPVSGMSDDDLIREYVRLDVRIKELAYERAGYQSALIQQATEVRSNQGTVHLETSDKTQAVKVEFRKDLAFDQAEIECAKELLGDEAFNQIFSTKYSAKVRNLKTFLHTKSANERTEMARAMIQETLKEVEKSPSISVERQ